MIDKNNFFILFREAEEDDDFGMDDLNEKEDKAEKEDKSDSSTNVKTPKENDSEVKTDIDSDTENKEDFNDDSMSEDETNADGEETEEPDVDPEEQKKENNKKLIYFKNYKSLYIITEDLINKIDSLEINGKDEKDKNLIVFVKEKSNKLLNNINIILKDKIETLDLKVLETVFINAKTEINLLIDLVEKVLNSTDSKAKKETIS